MKSEIIETRTSQFWLNEDGILWVKTLPQAYYTLADAQKNVEIMHQLADGQKRPVLVEMKQIKGMDGDARAYSAGDNVEGITLALAMVIGSTLGKTLGNLWLGINKPPFPSKIFVSEEEAITWLKDFLE